MNKNYFIKFIFILFGIIPISVFASTLTGGNFLVNGGFTSISSSGSGGTFIINNSADSVSTGNTTGGNLVASPAFAPLGSSNSGNTGGGNGNSSGSGGSYMGPGNGNNNSNNNNNNNSNSNTISNNLLNAYTLNDIKNEVSNAGGYCGKYLTTRNSISVGKNNDIVAVKKIQIFLNIYQNANLPIDGTYDAIDEQAVRDFQSKYMKEILLPWGYYDSTGVVYITTTAKINAIVCGTEIEYPDLGLVAQFSKLNDFLHHMTSYISTSVSSVFGTNYNYCKVDRDSFAKSIILRFKSITHKVDIRWKMYLDCMKNPLMNCRSPLSVNSNNFSVK